jgi:hypothetical protein
MLCHMICRAASWAYAAEVAECLIERTLPVVDGHGLDTERGLWDMKDSFPI